MLTSIQTECGVINGDGSVGSDKTLHALMVASELAHDDGRPRGRCRAGRSIQNVGGTRADWAT